MASAPLTVELADPEATVRFAEDVSLALNRVTACACRAILEPASRPSPAR
jgi:hypothetical protein